MMNVNPDNVTKEDPRDVKRSRKTLVGENYVAPDRLSRKFTSKLTGDLDNSGHYSTMN